MGGSERRKGEGIDGEIKRGRDMKERGGRGMAEGRGKVERERGEVEGEDR